MGVDSRREETIEQLGTLILRLALSSLQFLIAQVHSPNSFLFGPGDPEEQEPVFRVFLDSGKIIEIVGNSKEHTLLN